jgi:hypothetical protein
MTLIDFVSLALIFALLIAFDVVALRWGVDSRDLDPYVDARRNF